MEFLVLKGLNGHHDLLHVFYSAYKSDKTIVTDGAGRRITQDKLCCVLEYRKEAVIDLNLASAYTLGQDGARVGAVGNVLVKDSLGYVEVAKNRCTGRWCRLRNRD